MRKSDQVVGALYTWPTVDVKIVWMMLSKPESGITYFRFVVVLAPEFGLYREGRIIHVDDKLLKRFARIA